MTRAPVIPCTPGTAQVKAQLPVIPADAGISQPYPHTTEVAYLFISE